MGRFPNIAAAKAKTGAAKGKLYGMYAKEIYQTAKNGGVTPEGNPALKRLIDKAKKDQVPTDVINRAIEKVSSGADESYSSATYELFGPAGSTLIVDCLTDNVNRSVSDVRAVVNKCHVKMGNIGSVSYMYDNVCVVSFKGLSEEDTLDALIMEDVEVEDIETEGENVIVYGKPTSLYDIKKAIESKLPNVDYELDEITWLAKEKIDLTGEDAELFNKLLAMLDEVDDVQNVYHNVNI